MQAVEKKEDEIPNFAKKSKERGGNERLLVRNTNTTLHCFCRCEQADEKTGDGAFLGAPVCAKYAQATENKEDEFNQKSTRRSGAYPRLRRSRNPTLDATPRAFCMSIKRRELKEKGFVGVSKQRG